MEAEIRELTAEILKTLVLLQSVPELDGEYATPRLRQTAERLRKASDSLWAMHREAIDGSECPALGAQLRRLIIVAEMFNFQPAATWIAEKMDEDEDDGGE